MHNLDEQMMAADQDHVLKYLDRFLQQVHVVVHSL